MHVSCKRRIFICRNNSQSSDANSFCGFDSHLADMSKTNQLAIIDDGKSFCGDKHLCHLSRICSGDNSSINFKLSCSNPVLDYYNWNCEADNQLRDETILNYDGKIQAEFVNGGASVDAKEERSKLSGSSADVIDGKNLKDENDNESSRDESKAAQNKVTSNSIKYKGGCNGHIESAQLDSGVDVTSNDEDLVTSEEQLNQLGSLVRSEMQELNFTSDKSSDDLSKPFVCTVCSKTFNIASKLNEHKKQHSKVRPYVCDVCGKGFIYMNKLKIHNRTHTGERPYKCDRCAKSFSQLIHMTKHLRTHTGEKPYSCYICGKGFADIGSLPRHVRTHTGVKPYKCNLCGSYFTESGKLKRHQRTHTGERPYICEICGKDFTQMSTLKGHKRTHTGEKPFICKFCGRGFPLKGTLTRHERTHTGEKPCTCDICGKSYTELSHLKKHIIKSHPELNE